jgi:competence protein ComEA
LDVTRLLLAGAAVVGLAGMAWAVLHHPAPSPSPVRVLAPPSTSTPPQPTTSTASATTVPTTLVVDVAGAVARPGPVRIAAGARVVDAIAAAGGPSRDADLERVDRAAPVRDGERVYVPRVGQDTVPQVVAGDGGAVAGDASGGAGGATAEGGEGATSTTPSGPVDLNTADAATLETLPGVGPATAQGIIDYRTQHGRFARVEDLLDVKGIGPAKFAALRAHVTV